MPSVTRRALLRSALGAAPLAGASATAVATESPPFGTRWTNRLSVTGSVSDAVRLDDEVLVLALDTGTVGPHLVAVGPGGERLWTWRWDETENGVPVVAPAKDGGLFVAFQTDDLALALVKLDANREVAWQRTHDVEAGDLELVRTGPDHLVLVSAYLTTHVWWTRVYGFDAADGALVWENTAYSADPDAARYGTTVVPFADGCVVGGGEGWASHGWLARLTADGSVAWDRQFSADELQTVSDLVVRSGAVVAVGERETDTHHGVGVRAVDANGADQWTTTTTFGTGQSPGSIWLTSDPSGGFVFAAERPEGIAASTDERGTIGETTLIDPIAAENSTAGLVRFDDRFVRVGSSVHGGATGRNPWVSAFARPGPTPSPTSSPTPSPTPASTATERPTVTPPGTTDRSGPGFGLLAIALGIVGGWYLARGPSRDGKE